MADTLFSPEVPAPHRLPDALVGTQLNGFIITGTISEGGMGVVYEARHPVIGRRAAVKVIRPDFDHDPDLTARFLREARAVSAVKHRNVIEILDYGTLPGGGQYMMMEFLEGDTLAQVIAREAPMRPAQALWICEEILGALDAAHQVGVVHRDLKPQNIVMLRQSSGELIVKVLDFGLARLADTAPEPMTRESLRELSLEKSSCLAGTPEYISPEQAGGEQVSAQGDLYSLGVILYELLTQKLPFSAPSALELLRQHRLAEPPPPHSIVPGLDLNVEALVLRLLAKNPADRPLGAQAAAREVARLRRTFGRVADTVIFDRPRLRTARVALAATIAAGLVSVAFTFASATAAPTPPPPAPPVPRPPEIPPPLEVPPPIPPPPIEPTTAIFERRSRRQDPSCAATPAWRRAMREQVDALEQRSLARLDDRAPPAEVARIRQRARRLGASARDAQNETCGQVEAGVRAWRGASP